MEEMDLLTCNECICLECLHEYAAPCVQDDCKCCLHEEATVQITPAEILGKGT